MDNSIFKIFSIQKTDVANELVEIESIILSGIYKFSILGISQKNISETKDRIYSALRTQKLLNLKSHNKKITVNILPNQVNKVDSVHDVGIALSCLKSMRLLELYDNILVTGELSILGIIISTNQILSILHNAIKHNIKIICCNKNDIKTILHHYNKLHNLIVDNGIKFIVGDSLEELLKNIRDCIFYGFNKNINNIDKETNHTVTELINNINITKIIFGISSGKHILIEDHKNFYIRTFLKNLSFYRKDLRGQQLLNISNISNINDKDMNGDLAIPYIFNIDNNIIDKEFSSNINLSVYGYNYIDDIYILNKDIVIKTKKEHKSTVIGVYKCCLCGNNDTFFDFENKSKCLCVQRNILRYKNKINLIDDNFFDFKITDDHKTSDNINKLSALDYIYLNEFIQTFNERSEKIKITLNQKQKEGIISTIKDQGNFDDIILEKIFNTLLEYEKFLLLTKNSVKPVNAISKEDISFVINLFKKDF